jgi:hypothetical protein
MSKWQTMFSAEYINGAELEGKKWTVTITAVKSITLEGENKKKSNKAVISFKEMDRGWVLAKTNAILIAGLFGDETKDWIGKRVTIHSETVQVGTDTAPGIRVIGSPDIDKPISVVVKLARKKPRTMVMQPTGKAAAKPAPEAPAAPTPEDDPPPPDDTPENEDDSSN